MICGYFVFFRSLSCRPLTLGVVVVVAFNGYLHAAYLVLM